MGVLRERVCRVSDMANGQMREVVIHGSQYKVLLSRIRDSFYATSHQCPHYKAPLAKGSLSSEGRIICPWHAACFNVKTGDVEEAPAIRSLQTFAVEIVGEDVFVIAEEEQLVAGSRPACQAECEVSSDKVFLIVGGGAAGAVAAEAIRKGGFGGRVTVISKEPYAPIDRVLLSKRIDVDPQKIALYEPAALARMKIDLVLDKAVVAIHKDHVVLDDGTKMGYSKLLLATGVEPNTLQVAGADLDNVFVVRTAQDTAKIKAAFDAVKSNPVRVAIVGSGFIAMEMSAVFSKLGAQVTIIGKERTPLESTLGPPIGAVLQMLHEANGVEFVMGSLVSRFEAGFVVLKGERRIPTDIIVVDAGVRPQTDYVKETLSLEADSSILVDRFMRVVQVKTGNVFAAGNVATILDGDAKIRIEHWNAAEQQGRIAGHNMAQDDPRDFYVFDTVPFFWTMQFGKSLRFAGHIGHDGFDDIIIRGDPNNHVFEAFYICNPQA